MYSKQMAHVKGCMALREVDNGKLMTPFTSTPTIEYIKGDGGEFETWVVYRCLDVACKGCLMILAKDLKNRAYLDVTNGEYEFEGA